MTGNSISSVASLLEAVKDSGVTSLPHAHVRAWFRGQGDATWTLRPGVYRDGFAKGDEERVRKERHLSQDFVAMSADLRSLNQSWAEIYFLQQHYGMPTRLLDWSLSPLAAIFFALEPREKDGCLFVLDAYQFGKRGLCTPSSLEVGDAMKAIFEWNDECWPKKILAVRPSYQEWRVSSQRGCFTFHPPNVPELTDSHNPTLKKYPIPARAKADLQKEMELLGIDEFTIFGDLDHLAERLKRAYQNS